MLCTYIHTYMHIYYRQKTWRLGSCLNAKISCIYTYTYTSKYTYVHTHMRSADRGRGDVG